MVIWPTLLLVSGLLQLPAVSAQTITTSSQSSGIECGTSTPVPKCILGATCSNNECECPFGSYGNGDFNCAPNSHIRSQVSGNSNSIITLANTSADLYWPCRTRFTEIKTTRTSDGNKCHFQVFALNKVIGGRVMAAGVEVHFRVDGDDTLPDGIGIRKEGIANKGVFTFKEWGRDAFDLEDSVTEVDPNFTPDNSTDFDGSGSGDFAYFSPVSDDEEDDGWGAPEQLDIGSGQVVAAVLNNDNFAVVGVSDCGVDVSFRPPDEFEGQQQQTPGISVTVDASHSPEFPNPTTYVSESPESASLSSQAFQHGHSISLEALHRVMTQAAKQPHTSVGEECAETAHTYRKTCSSMSDRLQALTSCSFFLSDHQMVDCMETETDGTGYRSLNAFKLCLWNICSPNTSICTLMKERVEERGCMPFAPDTFQSMPCSV